MAIGRPKRWKKESFVDGMVVYTLSSWKYFHDYINEKLLKKTTYIFRGHGSHNWKLEPTIDRLMGSQAAFVREREIENHLKKFIQASRSRRGHSPAHLTDENEWWALARHHGLNTPLLDWTESPFVALYFAFYDALKLRARYVSVYAVSQMCIKNANQILEEKFRLIDLEEEDELEDDLWSILQIEKPKRKPGIIEIIRPHSDENPRLVNQRGLFTRAPSRVRIENWTKKQYRGEQKFHRLIKIRIPSKDATECLISLNRMNINHLSLFPDLFGASSYCNLALKLKNY